MTLERSFDLLVNGAVNATTPDERPRSDLVSAVCAEIAAGADVTDACAACLVSPADFLAWTVDDDDTEASYRRALRIRARLLADAPVRAARELGRVLRGTHESLGFAKLGEIAGAIKSRAELEGQASDRGEPPAAVKMTENLVRITFDPLPVHVSAAPADTQSVAASTEQAQLSASVPADYVIVSDETRDELA